MPTGAAAPAAARPTTARGSALAAAADPNLHNVTSPLLGTYYRAPKPGAPPYVEVGSLVEEDTIIGIVEVMKLMNSVTAGAAGEVAAVFVKDGDLVEFEQPLFAIRATS